MHSSILADREANSPCTAYTLIESGRTPLLGEFSKQLMTFDFAFQMYLLSLRSCGGGFFLGSGCLDKNVTNIEH